MCDFGRFELTVITGQSGLLYRQVYKKVSKRVCKEASKQPRVQGIGHASNQVWAMYT